MTQFEQVFRDNRDFIFKYLMKLSRDASLAEELTQETFFRGYMNFNGLRDKGKTGVWLCQIAKNCYFNWYKGQKKTVPIEESLAQEGEGMAETVEHRELSREAVSHLEELEEPYRQVLILWAYGGLSLKEISEIFGKSESWARVTFYRGKQKLLERMGGL